MKTADRKILSLHRFSVTTIVGTCIHLIHTQYVHDIVLCPLIRVDALLPNAHGTEQHLHIYVYHVYSTIGVNPQNVCGFAALARAYVHYVPALRLSGRRHVLRSDALFAHAWARSAHSICTNA